MDGRCSELNESQREKNRCPGFRGRGESAVYKKWESEKLWGQEQRVLKVSKRVCGGSEGESWEQHLPGRSAWELPSSLSQRCCLERWRAEVGLCIVMG